MKLYNYWRSSSSWRVRLVMALKNIPYEYVAVNLLAKEQHQPTHRQRNPGGSVPVLELDDGTCLSQSVAIVEYLEETFPTPALLPKEAHKRAQVRMLAEFINSGIQPYQNPFCTEYVRDECKADEKAFARHFISSGLASLEKMVAPLAGHCLFGNDVTLADCFLVPQLYASRRFDVAVDAFPTLIRVEKHLSSLTAFQQAAPDSQPDAP